MSQNKHTQISIPIITDYDFKWKIMLKRLLFE